MTNSEILAHIDHTNLRPDEKWENIAKLCEEALTYHTASVCIASYYVRRAKETYPALNVCTVIGFPLGYQPASVKQFEAAEAVADGADEIDMVINVSALKNGDDKTVLDEIRAVRAACVGQILKVIVETCLLTEEEKIRMCEIVTKAGADYIKTSTGFSTGGATFEDVKLFAAHVGPKVKIKAAGGISTLEDAAKFIALGASRLGTSRVVKLVKELSKQG